MVKSRFNKEAQRQFQMISYVESSHISDYKQHRNRNDHRRHWQIQLDFEKHKDTRGAHKLKTIMNSPLFGLLHIDADVISKVNSNHNMN